MHWLGPSIDGHTHVHFDFQVSYASRGLSYEEGVVLVVLQLRVLKGGGSLSIRTTSSFKAGWDIRGLCVLIANSVLCDLSTFGNCTSLRPDSLCQALLGRMVTCTYLLSLSQFSLGAPSQKPSTKSGEQEAEGRARRDGSVAGDRRTPGRLYWRRAVLLAPPATLSSPLPPLFPRVLYILMEWAALS